MTYLTSSKYNVLLNGRDKENSTTFRSCKREGRKKLI